MKAMVRHVDNHGTRYDALAFICPGCLLDVYDLPDGHTYRPSGLHMLPVNTTEHAPQWTWDGNLDAPTLGPSILTKHETTDTDPRPRFVCHSYLEAGVFHFLDDCTHALADQYVPMVDLPDWFTDD